LKPKQTLFDYEFAVFRGEPMSEKKTAAPKMCELHAAGLMEDADHYSDKPEFVCGKCRRKANRAENLHNPLPLKKTTGDKYWG